MGGLLETDEVTNASLKRDTIYGLTQKTSFQCSSHNNYGNKNVDKYLQNWIGANKLLPVNFHKQHTHNDFVIGRPKCPECEKFRCNHRLYRGKAKWD